MKCKEEPCPDGKHTFSLTYDASEYCGTPECGGGFEGHCLKCGWYIEECQCSCMNQERKISMRQRKQLEKTAWAKIKRPATEIGEEEANK